jgi:hypothetical protein
MTDQQRKAIPAQVARQLRREAGFGCCKCGIPILQYHHIVPWSVEEHYRPEDMMVLCPLHHDQATKGAMQIDEQRELKASPFNIQKGRVKGQLEVKQDYCAAALGTVTLVGEGCFLSIHSEEVLRLSLGEKNLEVSLKLFSESDELLIQIDKNEWIAGDPLPWDIKADWQVLSLREKARKIAIELDARRVPLRIAGEFWYSGRRVSIGRDLIRIEGRTCVGLAHLALVGGGIDLDPENTRLATGGAIVVASNPREQLWKARGVWKDIVFRRKTGVDL